MKKLYKSNKKSVNISNGIHLRMSRKHLSIAENTGSKIHYAKAEYHDKVIGAQNLENSIRPKSVRKNILNGVLKRYGIK